jgi:hypothetical protein
MKGEFFIISTVIIISSIVLISQFFFDFGRTDLTLLEQSKELEYVDMIRDSLNTTANISYGLSGCSRVDQDLNDAEDFLKIQLSKKGIAFEAAHDTSLCPEIDFKFNITTSKMFSRTEFTQTFS